MSKNARKGLVWAFLAALLILWAALGVDRNSQNCEAKRIETKIRISKYRYYTGKYIQYQRESMNAMNDLTYLSEEYQAAVKTFIRACTRYRQTAIRYLKGRIPENKMITAQAIMRAAHKAFDEAIAKESNRKDIRERGGSMDDEQMDFFKDRGKQK